VAAAFATTAKTVGKGVERILALRRQPITGDEIAQQAGASPANRAPRAAGLSHPTAD
jgi:hypothetical protein